MNQSRAIVVILVGLGALLIVFTKFSQWMDRFGNACAYADPPLVGGWEGEAIAGDTRPGARHLAGARPPQPIRPRHDLRFQPEATLESPAG